MRKKILTIVGVLVFFIALATNVSVVDKNESSQSVIKLSTVAKAEAEGAGYYAWFFVCPGDRYVCGAGRYGNNYSDIY